MLVYLLAVIIFLVFFFLTGIGVILKGRSIRGSCGGIAVMGPDGEPLTCATCPNRKKGKKYLKKCPSSDEKLNNKTVNNRTAIR